MTKLQLAGVLLLILFAAIGLGVVIEVGKHLYADHLWDDQIRAIQKQQLAPKPAAPAQ